MRRITAGLKSRRHWLTWVVLLCAAAPAAAHESLDSQYVAGLRERRLFRLAEVFCTERIANADLTDRQRTDLAVELARTYAEHAVQSPPTARAELWEQAHRVAADYRHDFPDDPWRVLVELQDALTWLARGELARQEAQVAAGTEARLGDAKQTLREAISRLEQAADDVAVQLRKLPLSGKPPAGGPARHALEALDRSIHFQLARAFRNQGLCYPKGSADRINSLTQAVEQLDPVAKLVVADDLIWRARIDRVVCYRLLGNLGRSTSALSALVEQGPPAHIALRAQAEKIHLLLARGQTEEALAEAEKGRMIGGQASGTLDFAHLEAQVAAWRAANGKKNREQAAHWQRRAAKQVRLIEEAHGPYWMRRAEMLLADSMAGSVATELPALLRAAESYYRARQIDRALAAYDRAYRQAIEQGDGQQAFDAAFTAATIQHDAGAHEDAMRRYRDLALALRKGSRAGEAHLLAILNAAARIRAATPSDPTDLTGQYVDLLNEHLKTWPEDATADQARVWLGRWHDTTGRPDLAVAAYRDISPESEYFAETLPAVAKSWQRWIDQLAAEEKPTDAVAADAAGYFEGVVFGPDRRWPTTWNRTNRLAASMAARLRLNQPRPDFVNAERLLQAALQNGDDASDAWKAEARCLLVFSQAGQGDTEAATVTLEAISAGSVEQLLDVLDDLSPLVAEADGALRRALAELQLRTVDRLASSRDKLSPAALETWETVRAAALAAAGRKQQALDAYEELAKKYPRNGRIQEARAALLVESNDPATLKAALAKWHDVEQKSRRGSDRWYRARLTLAETYHRLGEDAKAIKLIKLTQVLNPDLGGPELAARFRRLMAECQR